MRLFGSSLVVAVLDTDASGMGAQVPTGILQAGQGLVARRKASSASHGWISLTEIHPTDSFEDTCFVEFHRNVNN
jgi:hypothetical protein